MFSEALSMACSFDFAYSASKCSGQDGSKLTASEYPSIHSNWSSSWGFANQEWKSLGVL